MLIVSLLFENYYYYNLISLNHFNESTKLLIKVKNKLSKTGVNYC